MLNFLFSSEL